MFVSTAAGRLSFVAGLFFSVFLSACSTVPENTANLCRIYEEKDEWYDASKRAQKRWGTPIPVSMAFIRIESGYDDDAKPRRNRFLGIVPLGRPSSSVGYSQAVKGTWEMYERETGVNGDRNNFRDSVDFVAWYVRRNSRELGLSQSDAYSNYLAYHEGPAAYRKGAHQSKSWLLKTAQRVQSIAHTYEAQLHRCRDDLEDGFLFF